MLGCESYDQIASRVEISGYCKLLMTQSGHWAAAQRPVPKAAPDRFQCASLTIYCALS